MTFIPKKFHLFRLNEGKQEQNILQIRKKKLFDFKYSVEANHHTPKKISISIVSRLDRFPATFQDHPCHIKLKRLTWMKLKTHPYSLKIPHDQPNSPETFRNTLAPLEFLKYLQIDSPITGLLKQVQSLRNLEDFKLRLDPDSLEKPIDFNLFPSRLKKLNLSLKINAQESSNFNSISDIFKSFKKLQLLKYLSCRVDFVSDFCADSSSQDSILELLQANISQIPSFKIRLTTPTKGWLDFQNFCPFAKLFENLEIHSSHILLSIGSQKSFWIPFRYTQPRHRACLNNMIQNCPSLKTLSADIIFIQELKETFLFPPDFHSLYLSTSTFDVDKKILVILRRALQQVRQLKRLTLPMQKITGKEAGEFMELFKLQCFESIEELTCNFSIDTRLDQSFIEPFSLLRSVERVTVGPIHPHAFLFIEKILAYYPNLKTLELGINCLPPVMRIIKIDLKIPFQVFPGLEDFVFSVPGKIIKNREQFEQEVGELACLKNVDIW